jgi:hypothetical protein
VPYLRIPLVVSFFASEDRIHLLQSPALQALFDAVLFEPGAFLPARSAELEPVDVPTSAPELLGTPHHLLLNELMRSPCALVDGVLKLAKQATDLDTGTFKASTTTGAPTRQTSNAAMRAETSRPYACPTARSHPLRDAPRRALRELRDLPAAV